MMFEQRVHSNGWVASISYVPELKRYIGGAAPLNQTRPFGDYMTAERARAAADEVVRRHGNHPVCSVACDNWHAF